MEDEQAGRAEQAFKEIYNYSIRLLARREYSALELQHKLQNKFGAQQREFYSVLERLQEDNYQSDQRFAEAYLRFRAQKGFGPERIAMELNAKGVSPNDIDCALDEFSDNWEEIMAQQWRKKFNSPPANWQEKSKQCAYLKQRGFAQDSIAGFMVSLKQSV